MANTFTVRLASERDADVVWQLVLRMFESQRLADYFGRDKTQLAIDLQAGWIKCFLVDSNSEHKAVGFCIASLPYSTWVGQYLNLSAIFVEPEYRGQHLCTALVTAACRFARDGLRTTRIDCNIPESNTHAAQILKSFGFYDCSKADRWLTYRLDSSGLRLATKSEIRPGICLEGFGNLPGAPSPAYVVRPGDANDAQIVISLIYELAAFHGFTVKMTLTPEILARDIESGACGCVVAVETTNMRIIGMAVSWCFLTFEYGKMTHLEDIFLNPQHRGFGVGKALLVGTCLWARSQGAAGIDLRVKDWNTNAQAVYKAIGFEDEAKKRPITDFRCEHESLDAFLSRSLPEGLTF